jgi:predicted ester cyclase
MNEEVSLMKIRSTLLLVSAVICCLLPGCTDRTDVAEANKAIVLQAAQAINNHEYDKLNQFFAPDYKRHSQATADVSVESLPQFVNMLKYWTEAFPDGKQGIDMIIAEGDLVAFYGMFSGTNTAPMGNIPPTGKHMDSETIGFHRVVNGKIVETWVTWDNLAVFNQLGLTPPSAAEAEAPPEGQTN